MGFYVSSAELLRRVLRTFLYMSVGEHMWHFCRIDSLMARPWVIGYGCAQLSELRVFRCLYQFTLSSVCMTVPFTPYPHKRFCCFRQFDTIVLVMHCDFTLLWLPECLSFNLFNGHLDFLFCEISSQVFACSFIRLSTFSLWIYRSSLLDLTLQLTSIVCMPFDSVDVIWQRHT